MKFSPKSADEVNSFKLLPPGTYNAEIGTAEDKVSAAGNEMIKVDLSVYDSNGKVFYVFDYLLEALAYKLRHAAEACSLLDKYEAGNLMADDFIGKCCKVKIKIDKAKEPQYSDKNSVVDYVIDKEKQPVGKPEDIDDSIPW